MTVQDVRGSFSPYLEKQTFIFEEFFQSSCKLTGSKTSFQALVELTGSEMWDCPLGHLTVVFVIVVRSTSVMFEKLCILWIHACVCVFVCVCVCDFFNIFVRLTRNFH